MEALAVTRLLSLLAPPLLGAAAWVGAETWPRPGRDGAADSLLFLAAFLVGVPAGARVAWSAFHRGRRRPGRALEASVEQPFLRLLSRGLGVAACLFAGFVFWALGALFLRRFQ